MRYYASLMTQLSFKNGFILTGVNSIQQHHLDNILSLLLMVFLEVYPNVLPTVLSMPKGEWDVSTCSASCLLTHFYTCSFIRCHYQSSTQVRSLQFNALSSLMLILSWFSEYQTLLTVTRSNYYTMFFCIHLCKLWYGSFLCSPDLESPEFEGYVTDQPELYYIYITVPFRP